MGKRKQLIKKVQHHIKDLEKRGIDVERVTKGKSLEKLAWSQSTYDNFIKVKKNILANERDIKKRTNAHGYILTKNEYKTVKTLEKKYNKKKESELEKYKAKFGELSEVEEAFLRGEPIRHVNSKENIELQTSFRKENLFDSFGSNIDLKFYKEFVEEEIKDFTYESVIKKRREEFINEMREWANAYRFGVFAENDTKYVDKVVDKLTQMYDNMSLIQAVQFNQDMKHKLQYVDSASQNKYSSYDEMALLKDLMVIQSQRKFVISR